jgi:hypothetical protein
MLTLGVESMVRIVDDDELDVIGGRGRKVIDATDLYRRVELEKVLWSGRMDGLDESALAELVGLPGRDVAGIMESLLSRVQTDNAMMARVWAIRQTIALWAEVYSEAAIQWRGSHDPRYAEIMRGALKDIRDIWGVDSAKRLVVEGNVRVGVMHGVLGGLNAEELRMLEGIFGGSEARGSVVPGVIDSGAVDTCPELPQP